MVSFCGSQDLCGGQTSIEETNKTRIFLDLSLRQCVSSAH